MTNILNIVYHTDIAKVLYRCNSTRKVGNTMKMTIAQADKKARRLRELEAQQKALEIEAEKIRTELKNSLEAEGLEELSTPHYKIKWKAILSNRLDSKALKVQMPTVYEKFVKQTESKRFTVTTA